MMNKILKMRHIALIVSVIIIAIGMAVGTVCHFVSNGFFNYGAEFASYKSIQITTSIPEDVSGNKAKKIAEDALSSLGAYEVHFSEGTATAPNTVTYYFPMSASDDELASAVEDIKAAFEQQKMEDASAGVLKQTAVPDGGWQLGLAAIAVSCAAFLQAVYFAFRYKPGMALSSLCSQAAVVGIYAALLAITRCPVGIQTADFAVIAVAVTMICNGVFFSSVKNAFKDESNVKTDKYELIAGSAASTAKVNIAVCVALAVAIVIFGVFALIAAPGAATLSAYLASLIAVVACAFTFGVFTPASYGLLSAIDKSNN